MSRTVVDAGKAGLATIGVFSSALCGGWLWVAALAFNVGGLSQWLVSPVSLLIAGAFGSVAWWAFKRRANEEPGMIVDDAGIFDNVSITHAGRVRWRDTKRVWLVGPRWLQFLCILPDDIKPYIENQEEVRGAIMRLNTVLFGAPIVIPMAILEMPQDQVWQEITRIAGTPGHGPGTLAGA